MVVSPSRHHDVIILCLLQGAGDAISSFSVCEESQILPGQQEEKERLVHGRCPLCHQVAAGQGSPGRSG